MENHNQTREKVSIYRRVLDLVNISFIADVSLALADRNLNHVGEVMRWLPNSMT